MHQQEIVAAVGACMLVALMVISGINWAGSSDASPHPGLSTPKSQVISQESSRSLGRASSDKGSIASMPPARTVRSSRMPFSSGGPYVADTLVLENNTLIPGNYQAANGLDPIGVAYDSATGEIFIADETSTLSVISDASDELVANIPVGLGDSSTPYALAYDSAKGEVFVSDVGNNDVHVISDTTGSEVATVSGCSYPSSEAYDSARGEIFVADSDSNEVSVISDTTNSVVAAIGVGADPVGVAYDSARGEMFVTNENSRNVSVISDATNSVTSSIGLPGYVTGITYDSGMGEMFVAYQNPNEVSVISDATGQVVATIAQGMYPQAMAYDGAKGEVFVGNVGFDSLSVISDSTNMVEGSVTVGYTPYALAYDSGRGDLFVANLDSANVSVVSDATNTAIASIFLGTSPTVMAYDSAKGEMFVADPVSSNISVIADSTRTLIARIPVRSYPNLLAYDSDQGEIIVSYSGFQNLSAISDSSNTLVGSIALEPGHVPSSYVGALAVDTAKDELFVGTYGCSYQACGYGNVSVVSATNDTVVAHVSLGGASYTPEGMAYDGGKGEIFVACGNSRNVSVISDATNKVVANIPVGDFEQDVAYDGGMGEVFATGDSSLNVMSDSSNSVVASVPVMGYEYLNQIGYDSATGQVFVALPYANLLIVVSDTSDSVIGSFPVGAEPAGVEYDPGNGEVYVSNSQQGTISIVATTGGYQVTFTESGLVPGTGWGIVLNGTLETSAASTIGFSEPDGTYSYNVDDVSGWTSSIGSGVVEVNGAAVQIDVNWTQLTYPLIFFENGLPYGTIWSVTVAGSTAFSSSNSLLLLETNGSYWFTIGDVAGWKASVQDGWALVDGVSTSIPVNWISFKFNVSFEETGLPYGTLWSITMEGSTLYSTTYLITFAVANGSYIYTVGGVPGWTTYSYSGAVYEDGSSATFTISWTRTLYALTFVESGLPAGGEWSVYLDGTRQVSTSSSMVFDVSNGTYSYTVESPTNYSATPSSGSLKVSGSPATQNITFSSGLGFLGMPGDEGYFVLGAAIGLVALAAVVVAIFLRRRPRENIRPPPLAFEEANEIRPIPPEPPHLPPWTGSHSVDSDLTEAVPPESGSDGMA